MARIAAEDLDGAAALACLMWQQEAGVLDAVGDAPQDRYGEPASPPWAARARAPAAQAAPAPQGPLAAAPAPKAPSGGAALAEAVAAAERAAGAAGDLAALAAALAAYPHCDLKAGAKNTVFSDGLPGARVMIVGEAPGREEDQSGKPFVGAAGQLLDKMFAAIGLSRGGAGREHALYIGNVLPWRPPQNRTPDAAEVAMMKPFLDRHIALAAPEIVVLMGNTALQAALGRSGITSARGQWAEAWGRPVLPMFHPSYLLRTPAAKALAWADLLALKARLSGGVRA